MYEYVFVNAIIILFIKKKKKPHIDSLHLSIVITSVLCHENMEGIYMKRIISKIIRKLKFHLYGFILDSLQQV